MNPAEHIAKTDSALFTLGMEVLAAKDSLGYVNSGKVQDLAQNIAEVQIQLDRIVAKIVKLRNA